jgi:hypothetical protein
LKRMDFDVKRNSISAAPTNLLFAEHKEPRQWTARMNALEARLHRIREARERDNGISTKRQEEAASAPNGVEHAKHTAVGI